MPPSKRPERRKDEKKAPRSRPSARRRGGGARKRAGAAGKRARTAATSARRAGARGLRATATRTRPALRTARTRAANAARRSQPQFDRLITLVPRAILWGGRNLAALGGILSAAATRAARVVTPERGIAGVIVAAAICLCVAQFVTYRGVEVGEPQYIGVAGVAPPPQTDKVVTGAAHAYLLIPLAVAAVGLALLAVRRRRWRLARLVSVAGLAGIAVSLAVDLPKGLDTGSAGLAFQGAHATLTDGFYAQLAASAVLVLCGLLLSRALRGGATSKRRTEGRRRRSRGRAALAGGKA